MVPGRLRVERSGNPRDSLPDTILPLAEERPLDQRVRDKRLIATPIALQINLFILSRSVCEHLMETIAFLTESHTNVDLLVFLA